MVYSDCNTKGFSVLHDLLIISTNNMNTIMEGKEGLADGSSSYLRKVETVQAESSGGDAIAKPDCCDLPLWGLAVRSTHKKDGCSWI